MFEHVSFFFLSPWVFLLREMGIDLDSGVVPEFVWNVFLSFHPFFV